MELIIVALVSIGAIYMAVKYSVDQLKGSGSCHDCGGCKPK